MITKVETSREGKPLRIYHRAGTLTTEDGHKRPDEKFAWTHDAKEKKDCVACNLGTIPPEVKNSPQ